ncbi:hypothetical protein KKHLCK_05730 [Candidatus Electrothrix laxa]
MNQVMLDSNKEFNKKYFTRYTGQAQGPALQYVPKGSLFLESS